MQWQSRVHFFAIAARSMRRVLVDAARARQSLKRGGDHARVELDQALTIAEAPNISLLALDDALNKLSTLDERRARVVELRFFGGLNVEETAEALDVSPETVMRDWKVAKAWLFQQLNPPSAKLNPHRDQLRSAFPADAARWSLPRDSRAISPRTRSFSAASFCAFAWSNVARNACWRTTDSLKAASLAVFDAARDRRCAAAAPE